MTKQIYKTAQGKTVDLGTIKLRNEHVRAVGNMNVNARGDVLDSNNQVIDRKAHQIQRQNARLTNVSDTPVHTSSAAAKRAKTQNSIEDAPVVNTLTPVVDNSVAVVESPAPVDDVTVVPTTGGGLAAAIARSKIIKQEKEKTARQQLQSTPGVRKI